MRLLLFLILLVLCFGSAGSCVSGLGGCLLLGVGL